MSKQCKCEHWQQCPVCMPHRFDGDGNLLPPEPTPLQEARQEAQQLRDQLAASRDAEIVSLTNQRDYEYVRAENAEQERAQFEQESDKLREHVKILRGVILKQMASENRWPNYIIEALAATEELK